MMPVFCQKLRNHFQAFEDEYKSLRIETLLSGGMISVMQCLHFMQGAGGTESCDWAKYALSNVSALG